MKLANQGPRRFRELSRHPRTPLLGVSAALWVFVCMAEQLDLTIVYEPGEDGWIVASIPEVSGVFSQGRTRDEARTTSLTRCGCSMVWPAGRALGRPTPSRDRLWAGAQDLPPAPGAAASRRSLTPSAKRFACASNVLPQESDRRSYEPMP